MTLESELLGDGVQAYCPKFLHWRKLPRHRRGNGPSRELIQGALLPGYLFLQVDSAERFYSVQRHKDVFGFISTGVGPGYARDSDIQALKVSESAGAHNERGTTEEASGARDAHTSRRMAMQEYLSRMELSDISGQSVRLAEGALMGSLAEIERVERGTVHLRIGALSVQTQLGSLEPA